MDNNEPQLSGHVSLVYIGDHFYGESGTIMSPIYTEDGRRYDWGLVQVALRNGGSISIRQATPQERDHYEAMLSRMKRKHRAGRTHA